MLYLDYEAFRLKYLDTQRKYNEILSEKEELFTRTQPRSIRYDKERVMGGGGSNSFDNYLIAKDEKRIDERLAEVKSLLDDRRTLLDLKAKELRASKDRIDRVFVRRYLDHMKVHRIAAQMGYSESQIYRFLNIIAESLKHAKK